MQRFFLVLLTMALMGLTFSCGSRATGADKVAADSAPVTDAAADPSALPVEQDQVAFTRNVDPSTVKPTNMAPAPVVEGKPTIDVNTRPTSAGAPAVSAKKSATPSTPSTTPVSPPATQASSPAPAVTPPPVVAPAAAQNVVVSTPQVEAPSHEAWDKLLQRFVTSDGKVNYAGLKGAESELDTYLTTLKESAPTDAWGRNESMAYWINAYNAFTIKRILRDYPVASITDLDGGEPWKVKWIDIDGKAYSLNNIEHDILRPEYGDARIHFAVNCAAKSCPPLPNKAFTSGNLNKMLDNNARAFIRNTDYNSTSGNVQVSKIFDWYGEDFGDLGAYLNKYLATPIPTGKDIGFKEYDWSLNKQ